MALDRALEMARDIRGLGKAAAAQLPVGTPAHRAARRRIARPIDYMRYAEFESVLSSLALTDGDEVLDVSSPQWLSLWFAHRHPAVRFTYVNYLQSELDSFEEIASALGLKNITYQRADVRELPFSDESFDHVLSISVLEHISPEKGGDVSAVSEIRRVLKTGGALHLTVPYKTTSSVVYVSGPVYDRSDEQSFFAREYDRQTFTTFVDASTLSARTSAVIAERPGPFAVDYWEWGPGRGSMMSRLIRLRPITERLLGFTFDEALAKRHLTLDDEEGVRPVNIAAVLEKTPAKN